MNYRRQEIEKKLPPAPKTMLAHVWERCREANVQVGADDFRFIHQAVIEYLLETGEGKRVMLKILKASVKEASYTKQYYQAGSVGDETKQLDFRGLVEFSGWVYKGKAVPHDAVDVWDKPDLQPCDSCGGLFPKTHCVQTSRIIQNGREYLENMCNHCRRLNDDPRIRDTASGKTCETCTLLTCRFHSQKQTVAAPTITGTPIVEKVFAATQAQIEHKPASSADYSSI